MIPAAFPRRSSRRATPILLALCAALLAPAPAPAQDLGTLQGTITDAQGTPLSSAIVEVEMEIGNFKRGTTTDAAGRYRIIGLVPGPYRVNVRRTGYRNGGGRVLVALNEVLTQNFSLQVRPIVIDTLTVQADNPVTIRREDTEFSTEVREEAIELLPMRTDPKEAVALTPGARAEQVWGGSTAQANNYQIDGLSANHPGVGGDLVQPSINWVESIEVRGLGAAAEYGNFQGGLVNINTKRGTNDFQAAFRGALDGAPLTASNLQRYDVAAEMNSRYDLEGELRGPILRDKVFYYVAGQFIRRDEQVVNHLRYREGFYAPNLIDWTEQKFFGKLTVTPTRRDELVASAGYLTMEADRFGSLGYEDNGAYMRMTAPTTFYNLGFTHLFGVAGSFEASVSSFSRDERRESIAGEGVPALVVYGTDQIRPSFNAAPFNYRLAPSALSATTSLGWEMQTGPLRHTVKLGGEHSTGTWRSDRIRNGGMTWRPAVNNVATLDPQDPATWVRGSFNFVPTEWGGEVRLDADVRNSAVYLQDHIDLGSRVSVSPGVRYGWWTGWITPAEDLGTRFQAMNDQAFEARLGLTIDITGTNELVLKAHAGRYHQSMFAQFYERVEGAQVFSNQETWQYVGRPGTADQTFTAAEREALAAEGKFTLQQVIRLNQTGPVDPNYKQPYIDQLVVGLERQLGRAWKAELVYVGRRNQNMVALVDRNAATNYTRFDQIRIHEYVPGGGINAPPQPVVKYNGQPLVLRSLYIPNWMVVDHLRLLEEGEIVPRVPGLTPADIPSLRWDPDYVITNVPEADRTFHQVQAVVKMGYPKFGGTFSAVWSRLRGNLDNVAGYDDPSGFGAGPFVNPNQSVNFYGDLPNSSVWDLKAWAYGDLGRGFRAGIFWNELVGDVYTPHLTLSETEFTYQTLDGRPFPGRMLASVYGQPLFVETRGKQQYPNRATIDLHLERATKVGATDWLLTLDGFNVLGRTTPTRYNTSVNEGLNYTPFLPSSTEPENFYRAVRERVRPRSIRIGAAVKF
ncbi:TonB-dependent receptor [Longimicrobium sp.]|uniref:TonB-dependent receptor n=1 Tax=Longimicrobium sp. TaxID=2029185 RepID=UPI003B39FBA2